MSMEKNKHTDTTNEAIKSSDPKRGSRIGRFAVPAVVGISSVLGVGGATSLLMGHNAIHQADQIVGTNRLDAQNIISQSQKINEDNQTIQQFQRKSNNLKSSHAEPARR